MSKTYTFSEVSEILHLSPATIYKWESHIPQLKPSNSEGGRKYSAWEFELLKHTKRFFFTYNQDIERTQIAVERWMSRNPRSQTSDLDALNYGTNSRSHLIAANIPQRSVGKSNNVLEDLLDENDDLKLQSDPPKDQSLIDHSKTEPNMERLDPKQIKQVTAIKKDESSKPVAAHKAYYGQHQYQTSSSSHDYGSNYTSSVPVNDMNSFIDVAGDHSEVQTWKRAFNEAQSKLTQTKAELARSQDHLRQQHAAIKQLQADFNALKELIRKEIYDLRDLVIDKD